VPAESEFIGATSTELFSLVTLAIREQNFATVRAIIDASPRARHLPFAAARLRRLRLSPARSGVVEEQVREEGRSFTQW
jgi:hypothetical protein